LLTFLSLMSYLNNYASSRKLINNLVVVLAGFTVCYIGGRSSSIGTDTLRYEKAFRFYEDTQKFIIRKDVFYDFLSYSFATLLGFQELLVFCAFLSVFGAYHGLKKIFKENLYLPFILF